MELDVELGLEQDLELEKESRCRVWSGGMWLYQRYCRESIILLVVDL